jgi:iron-sulfur cluster repair protein YtfE (RIC family)
MRHPSLIPLSHDHHHGLGLALRCRKQALGRIKPLGSQGLKERAEEFKNFFSQNLTPHFKAEEEALFPWLRAAVADAHPLIDDLLRDHEQLRAAAAGLGEGRDLAKILFDVGDILERHIRREERELFPLFEKHVGASDGERLKAEIERILAG